PDAGGRRRTAAGCDAEPVPERPGQLDTAVRCQNVFTEPAGADHTGARLGRPAASNYRRDRIEELPDRPQQTAARLRRTGHAHSEFQQLAEHGVRAERTEAAL